MQLICLIFTALMITGCSNESSDKQKEEESEVLAPTNRIAIPSTVRNNLGITFAAVKKRDVINTMRAPGYFEALPSAHVDYHATVSGYVELFVKQYDQIEEGTLLYRLDSPQWRTIQRDIAQTINSIRSLRQRIISLDQEISASKNHVEQVKKTITIWQKRVDELQKLSAAGGGKAAQLTESRGKLATTNSELSHMIEQQAVYNRQKIEAKINFGNYAFTMPRLFTIAVPDAKQNKAFEKNVDLSLSAAASILNVPVDYLLENVGSDAEPLYRWRTIDKIDIRANKAGIIETLNVTNGSWIEAADEILTTVDPKQLRFRATALQSDLGRLQNGLPAIISPPHAAELNYQDEISGEIEISLEADPTNRTIDLLVKPNRLTNWTRPGVSAFLTVSLQKDSKPELAIPTSCVIRDGVNDIFFRRDPKNPDQVIRVEADLGRNDGRWVEVLSSVKEGDEIVLHGVYELNLASASTSTKTGHFLADGTYHEAH